MPQLHLTKADGDTEVFALESGEMLLGRETYCDIQLDFAGISRRHLRLMTVLDNTFLEDLGSRNGTFVNGRLTRKCALQEGDVVQVGEIELRFDQHGGQDEWAPPADPDATTVLPPGQFGPRGRAARETSRPVVGISPVAPLGEAVSIDPMRPQFDTTPEEEGWWGRLKAWFRR